MQLNHLEFLTLPTEEQGGYVFSQGTYLASRQEGTYSINLYYLHTFYCELWMDQHSPELDFFRTFTNQRCLYPYLQQLSLPIEHSLVSQQPSKS
jgi:hypothetical protein